jgi:hypothetical protein
LESTCRTWGSKAGRVGQALLAMKKIAISELARARNLN